MIADHFVVTMAVNLQQPLHYSASDHMRPVLCPQLEPNILYMTIHRPRRDIDMLRHFLGRQSLSNKFQYLMLSQREYGTIGQTLLL